MNITELRKKTLEDLKKELEKLEKDSQKITASIMQKKEKNTSKVKEFKKDIARLKTLVTEKLKEKKNEL
jgi:large subunit ribosomal protein L29